MAPCPEEGKFDVLGPTLYTRFLIAFKIITLICSLKLRFSAWTSLRDWRIFVGDWHPGGMLDKFMGLLGMRRIVFGSIGIGAPEFGTMPS